MRNGGGARNSPAAELPAGMTSACNAAFAEPANRIRVDEVPRRFEPPFLLLLPAIVVLVAVIAAPLLFSLYSSFTAYRLTRPETLWTLVGLRNYVNVFSDPVFWRRSAARCCF